MALQPLIFFIGDSFMPDMESSLAKALEKGAELEFGCKLISFHSYDHFFSELKYSSRLLIDDRLIAMIVDQGSSRDIEEFRNVTKVVRQKCPTLPILIRRNYLSLKMDENMLEFDDSIFELAECVDKWRKKFPQQLDHYSVSSKEEADLVIGQLLTSHQKQYSDDDRCITDEESRVTAQAIRVRLCPAECLRAEFDSYLIGRRINLVQIQRDRYESDCEKVRQWCREYPDGFHQSLIMAGGSRLGGSSGVNLLGFAVDLETGTHSITSGFAEHELALQNVQSTLRMLYILRGHDYETTKELVENSAIIWGLIHQNVGDIETPIAQFRQYFRDDEAEQLVAFFSKTRIAIPVGVNQTYFIVGEDPDKPKRP